MITVLIPAYNTEAYIGEAVQSVIDQDYWRWHILVVDDGSTDKTAEVVKGYQKKDKRISLLSIKHSGVAEATRVGLEHVTAPLVTILDSDDRLLPRSLSIGVQEFLNNPRLGYAWSRFKLSTGGDGWSSPLPRGAANLWDALVHKKWWRGAHEIWIRMSTYNKSRKLDGEIQTSSDLQLAVVMANTGCQTKHIPEYTYWYRNDDDRRRISVGARRHQILDAKRILKKARSWDTTKQGLAAN